MNLVQRILLLEDAGVPEYLGGGLQAVGIGGKGRGTVHMFIERRRVVVTQKIISVKSSFPTAPKFTVCITGAES